jgi:hypothetical protein
MKACVVFAFTCISGVVRWVAFHAATGKIRLCDPAA